jgi:glycosyltransferase involved in cell wall biosynthesis
VKRLIICHLADFSAKYSGTFVDAMLSLARYCRQQLQIEMTCLFPHTARERDWLQKFDSEGVRYAFLPRRRFAISALQSVLGEDEPIVLHTHFTHFDQMAVLFKLVFYRRASVIWHFHETARLNPIQRLKDVLKIRVLARFCEGFIAVGAGTFQSAIARGLSPAHLILVQNGINIARFRADSNRRLAIREELGIPAGVMAFLLLGWEPKRKGVDVFAMAVGNLGQEERRNKIFLIVGGCETIKAIAEFPRDLLSDSPIRVISPRENFPALLDAIDIFVSASRSEGFSYAMAEALAAGKLVLSSDIPGVREGFEGSPGLWLFPNEDWRNLMQLMQRSGELSDNERSDLSRANVNYAAERLSLEAWTEKIGVVYRGILARHPLDRNQH